jgi:regulatory protein
MKVTRIAKQERRDRYNIFIDDEFYTALSADLLLESKIGEGDILQTGQLDEFIERDGAGKVVTKALDYVSRRPHSESELRTKLGKKDYDESHIDEAIERLNQLGYVDDEAFARQWIAERGTQRGKRLLQMELRKKGVADAVIEQVLEEDGSDEVSQARELAAKRLGRLSGHSPDVIKRRLTDYLARRGYSYDVIREALSEETLARMN